MIINTEVEESNADFIIEKNGGLINMTKIVFEKQSAQKKTDNPRTFTLPARHICHILMVPIHHYTVCTEKHSNNNCHAN